MSVSYVNRGSSASGTTSLSVPHHATTVTAGNLLVMFVAHKYPAQDVSTPAGWTAPSNNVWSGGAGASGVDTGQVEVTAFYKTAAGTEAGTSETVTVTSANSSVAFIMQFSRSGGSAWGVTATGGAQNTGGSTAVSVTGAVDLSLAAGDMVAFAWAANNNLYTHATPTLTATGATIGSVTEQGEQSSALGDDMALVICTGAVTAGPSSAAPVGGMTASGSATDNPAGAMVFLRLYEGAAEVSLTDVDTDETTEADGTNFVASGTLMSDMNVIGITDANGVQITGTTDSVSSTQIQFDAPTFAAARTAGFQFGACTYEVYRSDSFLTAVTGHTFSRSGPQTGIDSGGLLYSAATDVAAHISGQGVLLEGSRTNLLLRSQEFDNASWSKTRSSCTGGSINATTAPDGTTTADKMVEDSTASNTHLWFQSVTKAASAIQYTFSVYLKAAERSAVMLRMRNTAGSAFAFCDVNVSAGTIGSATVSGFTAGSTSIVSMGSGWYRAVLTATSDTDTAIVTDLRMENPYATTVYTGDGTSGIYVWGAQLEANAFASSYIATTTAPVLRNATSLTRAHTFPSNNFSFCAYVRPQVASTDTTDAQEWLCFYYDASNYLKVVKTTTAGQVTMTLAIGGTTATTTVSSQTWAVGDQISVRGRKNSTGIRLWIESTASTETTSGVSPNAWTSIPNTIRLGQDESTNVGFLAFESLKIWHESKSNAFMDALT